MNKKNKRELPLRLTPEQYEKLAKLAKQENRSMNNMVAQLIEERKPLKETG